MFFRFTFTLKMDAADLPKLRNKFSVLYGVRIKKTVV
jgi:hypothetical protein